MVDDGVRAAIDTSTAHPARVYDYLLGGRDNFEADRKLAEAMIASIPTMPMMARANRAFLGRAVEHLVGACGIRQFVDIGSGVPTAWNTHQVAQDIDPEARVVYVDNDPVMLAHARALLAGDPLDRTAIVDSDARDPAAILTSTGLARTLDMTEPVAVMLVSVLMYFDGDEARRIVGTLIDAVPAGSALVISHPTADFAPEVVADAVAAAARGGLTYLTRSQAEVTALFDGLEVVAPGVVPMLQWRTADEPDDPHAVYYYAGVARKAPS